MSAAENLEADVEEQGEAELVLRPQPGPQTRLLESDATVTFYGGEGGGGKTFGAELALARWFNVPRYKGILFRREATDLVGAEGAWELSHQIMGALGGVSRTSPLRWIWPEYSSSIEMRGLEHENDVKAHQGKRYACIVLEEGTHFLESQFWYLFSRLQSNCGVTPHMIVTCNPDPDSFIAKLIAWWIDQTTGLPIPERSGVKRWFVRKADDTLDWGDTREEVEARHPGRKANSMTFIRARLSDNPALTSKDPDYARRVDALTVVERARLADGNWKVRAGEGSYFRSAWFPRAPFIDPKRIKRQVRAWDLAATEPNADNPEPDCTSGTKLARIAPDIHPHVIAQLLRAGERPPEDVYAILHSISKQLDPGAVDALILETAIADGKDVEIAFWQDPGQAGKAQARALVRKLANMGYAVHTQPASANKEAFARVWSPLVKQGDVTIVTGDWTDDYLARIAKFPVGRFKDDVDSTSLGFQVLTTSAGRPTFFRHSY